MLNETEREAALEIVLSATDSEKFSSITDRLCQEFPDIEPDDLISLWREAGERQLAEADALETYARQRLVQ